MLVSVSLCIRCCIRRSPVASWYKRADGLSRVLARRPSSSSQVAAVTESSRLDEALRSDCWNNYLKRLEKSVAAVSDAACTQVAPNGLNHDKDGREPDHEERASIRGHAEEAPGQERRRELHRLVPLLQELRRKEAELKELQHLLGEDNEDLRILANTEIESCQADIQKLNYQIACLLIQREEADDNDLVVEVTAGVGGQEAMLFTSEIFDMYRRYAAYKNWNFDILEYFTSDLGGLRHATASVGGQDAYKHLKFEGGVHRVQRVPKTEKQGRIHTSTMSVAILPLPSEINLVINPKDLRIETKRASGAGGQHVNTTDSAVRIVHIPSGIVSECQQERSQIKNKEKAMKVLRAKLYSMKLEEETKKRYNARKIQVGTKGRSEKIRTYNFTQDRVTDHRIGMSLHNIEGFMFGEELLDEMMQSLTEYADYECLMEMIADPSL